MELIADNCINCGNPVSTRYCANCGQTSPPKKLNMLTLYSDFQSRIYGFDGMFPRTLRDLTVRPGVVAKAYIGGNRVKYVAPVGYFFLALTMFLLFMEILGIDLFMLSKTDNPFDIAETKNQEEFQRIFSDLMGRNIRIFSFLLIPITAAFAWLFFRRQKYNLLEHSILIFYIYGHLIWFSILNLFLFKFFELNVSIYQLILQALFYAFGCVGLYRYQSKVIVFLKGILISVLAFIFFTVLISLFGFIYLLSHPELLDLLKQGKQI